MQASVLLNSPSERNGPQSRFVNHWIYNPNEELRTWTLSNILHGPKHGFTFAAVREKLATQKASALVIVEGASAVPASSNSDSNSNCFPQEITRIKMLDTCLHYLLRKELILYHFKPFLQLAFAETKQGKC